MLIPAKTPRFFQLGVIWRVISCLQLGGALTCGLLAPTFNLIFTTKNIGGHSQHWILLGSPNLLENPILPKLICTMLYNAWSVNDHLGASWLRNFRVKILFVNDFFCFSGKNKWIMQFTGSIFFCMSTINIPKYTEHPSSWSSCAQNQRHLCCTLAHSIFTDPFSSRSMWLNTTSSHETKEPNKKFGDMRIFFRQHRCWLVKTDELKWHKERFRFFSHFLGWTRSGRWGTCMAWWLHGYSVALSKGGISILEDHPMTCKWLITMVIVSSRNRGGPLPNGRYLWLINGVTNYLLTGMILQVPFSKLTWQWNMDLFEEVFPIEDGDFPASHVTLPECNCMVCSYSKKRLVTLDIFSQVTKTHRKTMYSNPSGSRGKKNTAIPSGFNPFEKKKYIYI